MVVLWPILIPFLTAISALFGWGNRPLQRVLSVTGSVGLVAAALNLFIRVYTQGVLLTNLGDWDIPFGIVMVADLLSAIMVLLTSFMALAVVVYSLADIDEKREAFGFHPLFHILLMGICGSFLTGDLFNLYVWFEVMLLASFVLVALGNEREQLNGAIKYVTINLVSSAIFLAAVGIIYGLTGSLNMADIAHQLTLTENQGLVTTVAMLFLMAFGIKSAIFPLFFWLPASYHTPPITISAIFAGLLTKVGVYAIIRVFTLLFRHNIEYTHNVILILAGLTITIGILGAIAQTELRRILSFNLISHIGYMLLGLGLANVIALSSSIFYMIHHIVVMTALFLLSGVIRQSSGTTLLKKLGGLYRSRPWISLLFLIPALSLAGIPPLSGFWGKVGLLQVGIGQGEYGLVLLALLGSFLTLYSMMLIWSEVFWKAAPAQPDNENGRFPAPTPTNWRLLLGPVIALALLIIIIGFGAGPLFAITDQAAADLLSPIQYIGLVTGGGH